MNGIITMIVWKWSFISGGGWSEPNKINAECSIRSHMCSLSYMLLLCSNKWYFNCACIPCNKDMLCCSMKFNSKMLSCTVKVLFSHLVM